MKVLGLLVVFWSGAIVAADDWQLRGRVVDEAGRPVAGATVDHYWRGNGKQVRADGTPLGNTEEDLREHWGHLGEMEPLRGATTAADGTFTLDVSNARHSVMAMDRDRKSGCLFRVPHDQEDAAVEIRLGPLTRVRGKLQGAAWTNVYVMIPEDPARPTDNFRIAQCGSYEGRFEFALPPGKFSLYAYGSSRQKGDEIDVAVAPDPVITLSGKIRELDLGVLQMTPTVPSPREQAIAKAIASGNWGDYKNHFGQPPPKWRVVDARGVNKDVLLSDFRGKWVLIDFWGFSCPACLRTDLPALMKFYDEHAAERDRFEIVAFCIDSENELKSLADVDRLLKPIVAHVWKGRTLRFPQLLDPSFTTAQRYGLRGYGAKLLIDPEGNLVEGDEKTLAERLKQGGDQFEKRFP